MPTDVRLGNSGRQSRSFKEPSRPTGSSRAQLRHPTQLYEATFHLGMAAVCAGLHRQGRFPRQLIKLYFLAYFVFRFFSEFLRTEPRITLGLTIYQWACLALFPVFVLLWYVDAQHGTPGPPENAAPEPHTGSSVTPHATRG